MIDSGLLRVEKETAIPADVGAATLLHHVALGIFNVQEGLKCRADVVELVDGSFLQLDGEHLVGLFATVKCRGLHEGASVGRLAIAEFQIDVFFQRVQDFVRRDDGIAIPIVLAEFVNILAALLPFPKGDLAIPILVEVREPRRQTHRLQTAVTNREFKRSRSDTGSTRRDESIGSGPVRAISEPCLLAFLGAGIFLQYIALRIFQIQVGVKCRTHVLDLVGFALFQVQSEHPERLLTPVKFIGFQDKAFVGRLAIMELQFKALLQIAKDFVDRNQFIAIQIVFVEFGGISAALEPFLERDLAIPILVQVREPQR